MRKISAIFKKLRFQILSVLAVIFFIWAFTASYLFQSLQISSATLSKRFTENQKSLNELKNQDQYKINQQQQAEIKAVKTDYKKSIDLFDQIMDLKAQKQDTSDLDKLYILAVGQLADFNYSSADATLKDLATGVNAANSKLTTNNVASLGTGSTAPATSSNTPPGSGFSRQSVQSDMGTFTVAIIAADLNSTKVIVDTASDSDCSNNCPAIPLADYVSRNSAYAGINGTYFCPPDYPECAGKINSFDTLLMNKNKHYFNSDNNKYSTVPLVYTSGSSFGVRGQSLDWGRDTGVDMVLAMQPLLISGGNIVYGGSDIAKYNAPGVRSFIANKGSMVYIGEVFGATMEQGAHVLKTLGMDNALNLDEGGSTALFFNGSYISGPGRALPNAVLFLHK